jgi:hypothetical protein
MFQDSGVAAIRATAVIFAVPGAYILSIVLRDGSEIFQLITASEEAVVADGMLLEYTIRALLIF